MQTTFEKLGGIYRQEGDYLLPGIEAPVSPQVGVWGRRRHQHLRTNKTGLYTTMLLDDTLNSHLEEMVRSATEMFDYLLMQMKNIEGVTEELKASNQLERVQRMNNIRNCAEEIVNEALIYT